MGATVFCPENGAERYSETKSLTFAVALNASIAASNSDQSTALPATICDSARDADIWTSMEAAEISDALADTFGLQLGCWEVWYDAYMGEKSDYVLRQAQDRRHTCHWPGCDKQVPPAMWGCKPHWFKLPKYLRDAVWDAYVPGQEQRMDPSDEYLRVAFQVQEWIENRPPERTEEMKHNGQVWVRLNYPDGARWEVRGTGVVLDDETWGDVR